MSVTDDFLFNAVGNICKYDQNKTNKFGNFVIKLKKKLKTSSIFIKQIVHSLNETN